MRVLQFCLDVLFLILATATAEYLHLQGNMGEEFLCVGITFYVVIRGVIISMEDN